MPVWEGPHPDNSKRLFVATASSASTTAWTIAPASAGWAPGELDIHAVAQVGIRPDQCPTQSNIDFMNFRPYHSSGTGFSWDVKTGPISLRRRRDADEHDDAAPRSEVPSVVAGLETKRQFLHGLGDAESAPDAEPLHGGPRTRDSRLAMGHAARADDVDRLRKKRADTSYGGGYGSGGGGGVYGGGHGGGGGGGGGSFVLETDIDLVITCLSGRSRVPGRAAPCSAPPCRCGRVFAKGCRLP